MDDSREKAYKFVAYSAVSFAVIAVLSVSITMPMVYNYIHSVSFVGNLNENIEIGKKTSE
jgi:hypothetical protein